MGSINHMTRRDLLIDVVKKCIWVFKSDLNVNSATKKCRNMLYEQTYGLYFIFKAVLKVEIDFWYCIAIFHAYFMTRHDDCLVW